MNKKQTKIKSNQNKPSQSRTQTQTQKHKPPNSDIKIPMYGRFKKCLILFFFWDKYIIVHFLGIFGSGLDIFYSKCLDHFQISLENALLYTYP